MTKKQQLYFLLESFLKDSYDVDSFCKAFEGVFYPNVPYEELEVIELNAFKTLAEVVVRFSPFVEDLEKYPDVYRTENEVREAIYIAVSTLSGKCSNTRVNLERG